MITAILSAGSAVFGVLRLTVSSSMSSMILYGLGTIVMAAFAVKSFVKYWGERTRTSE
jgi:hypothetical protein